MAFTRSRTELVEEVFREQERYFSLMEKAGKFKRRLLKDDVFARLVESEHDKGSGSRNIELYICTKYEFWINRTAYFVLNLIPEKASTLLCIWAHVFQIGRNGDMTRLLLKRLESLNGE